MTHQLKNKTTTSVASAHVRSGKKGNSIMPPPFQLKSDSSDSKTLKQVGKKGNQGTIKTTNSSTPSVLQAQLAPVINHPIGVALGSSMIENYLDQEEAIRNPSQVSPDGRLGAMLSSQKFEEGQVGYGANPSIRGIHTVFGNVGEQGIGSVFNSPEAQRLMASPSTFKNNRALGQLEYDYWKSQVGQGETWGDEAMIRFGAAVPPGMRAGIQMGMGAARGVANDVREGIVGAGNWVSKKWGSIFN